MPPTVCLVNRGDAGVPDGIAPVYAKGLDASNRPGLGSVRFREGRPWARRLWAFYYEHVHEWRRGPLQAPLSCSSLDSGRQLLCTINFTRSLERADPFVATPFRNPPQCVDRKNGMRLAVFAATRNLSIQRHSAMPIFWTCRYIREQGDAPAAYDRGQPRYLRPRRDVRQRRSAPSLRRLPRAIQGPSDFRIGGLITNQTNLPVTMRAACLSRVLQARGRSPSCLLHPFSKSLDYFPGIQCGRTPLPRLVGRGEYDPGAGSVQSPRAEHGPSALNARHRFVFSGSYESPPRFRLAPHCKAVPAMAALMAKKLNTIANSPRHSL